MNKRSLVCIVLAFCLGACSTRPEKVKVTDSTLSISIDFSPAFDSAISVTFQREQNRPSLIFAVHDKPNHKIVLVRDSVPLSEEDWVTFIQAVDTSVLRDLQPTKLEGLDGIDINVTYSCGTSGNAFYAWSPDRSDNAGVYQLLDPTFRLMDKRLPSRENLIENLQNYLEYGLPVKIKSKSPFVARLYGSLSVGCEADLQQFFSTVPVDSTALLDCSNFHGMGTLLYPYFEKFARTHPKTIWVVGPDHRKELLAAEVNQRSMVSSLSEALARAK